MTNGGRAHRNDSARNAHASLLARTLVIGNSGSGKSWLAERLAKTVGCKSVDLDSLHWESGTYGAARTKTTAIELVLREASEPTWVIEGVYGWLAQKIITRATALIWLDLSVAECLDHLRHHGPRHSGDEAAFAALMAWAGDYGHRQTSSSFVGHEAIFTSFSGWKLRLLASSQTGRFVEQPCEDGDRARR